MTHFDIEKLEAKLKGLEEEILSPDFWNNIRAANKKIDEKNDLEYKIKTVKKLNATFYELKDFISTLSENDEEMISLAESDYLDNEVKAVKEYLNKGKAVLVLTGYINDSLPKLNKLLKEYGLINNENLVIDKDSARASVQSPAFMYPIVEEHEITKDFKNVNDKAQFKDNNCAKNHFTHLSLGKYHLCILLKP